jgi:hypothetical protein
MGGGVLNPAIEHVGDLTHRMNDRNTLKTAGYEYVKDKVEKSLRWLTHKYGFEKEFGENIANNAAHRGVDPEALRAEVTAKLNAYADAHAALPVYNEAQTLARDAAVSLGRQDFKGAIDKLQKLKLHLNSPEEWEAFAREGVSKETRLPNTRKLSDSFAPTELPQPGARPFGSTGVKDQIGNIVNDESGNPIWDTTRQPKTQPQALGATTGETAATGSSSLGKQPGISKASTTNSVKGVPAPGQATNEVSSQLPRSKDINSFRAEFGSVDKTLSSRPETAPIAEHIVGAADQKAKWIATTERQLADITKGLNKSDLVTLGELVDKGIQPGMQVSPDLEQRAKAIKGILDQIHAELKLPEGMNIGYIYN